MAPRSHAENAKSDGDTDLALEETEIEMEERRRYRSRKQMPTAVSRRERKLRWKKPRWKTSRENANLAADHACPAAVPAAALVASWASVCACTAAAVPTTVFFTFTFCKNGLHIALHDSWTFSHHFVSDAIIL